MFMRAHFIRFLLLLYQSRRPICFFPGGMFFIPPAAWTSALAKMAAIDVGGRTVSGKNKWLELLQDALAKRK
jgi:hypothetical protein